jgi:signal transduction histidine kinase
LTSHDKPITKGDSYDINSQIDSNNSNLQEYESEKTEVWVGQQKAMSGLLRTMSRVKYGADIVGDSFSPSFSMEVKQIRNGYDDFKSRNVKIRFITEITKDNLSYCKELLQYADLRHIAGLKGNMAVSETEYVATARLAGEAKPVVQTIYSNVKAVVEQQKYFFDNLWKKAIPAEQRIREIEEGIENTEINVIYDTEEASQKIKFAYTNLKKTLDVALDRTGPSAIIQVPEYKKYYESLKDTKVRIRFVTEVTPDNLNHCKQFIKDFGVEIRHIKGIKGNSGIFDNKWYLATHILEEKKSVSQMIFSNVKSVVEQNQYVFDTLWSKAIPAEQRIRELEEGLLPVETKILDTPEEIISSFIELVEKTEKGLSMCTLIGGLQLLYNIKPLVDAYKGLIKRYKERDSKDSSNVNVIRCLTHIENNKEQVDLIKNLIDIGFCIRHLDEIPTSMSFAISEKLFESTIEKLKGGEMVQNVFYSTEPLYIQHYQALFDRLWDSSIEVNERFRQIEKGISSKSTKVIENPIQSKDTFLQIVENAREELLFIFPSINSVKRQAEIGLFNLLKLKNQQNFRIKILSPDIDKVKEILLLEYAKEKDNRLNNVAIREIVKQQEINSLFIMADKKYMLVIEVTNDSKVTFEEAIGLTTYSTSYPTVLSYISIFETLWIQTEMFDNLRVANEKLAESEELEKDFINIAAHELRTPAQAISGNLEIIEMLYLPSMKQYLKNGIDSSDIELADLAVNKQKRHEFIKGIGSIYRNSQRLERLIDNILDVSRIENNKLVLNKEYVNINEIIKNVIADIQTIKDDTSDTYFVDHHYHMQNKDDLYKKKVEIQFETFFDPALVYADKLRIHQVISNLTNNSIKFSNGLPISISVKRVSKDIEIDEKESYRINTINDNEMFKKEQERLHNVTDSEMVTVISVKDMGDGIDSEVYSRLFTKFVSKSSQGTGLGLYISKKIVEAHGGRIWAFNNNNGKGCTFEFTLPK